ncbi:MAG: hypothetical protein IBX62_07890 [Coriobacteriia bacterium]|nr:hypothetical protein [Coriobacteriia bacterium]
MGMYGLTDEIAREEAERMLDSYSKTLSDLGYKPEPYPDLEGKVGGNIFAAGKFEALNHAYWMCGETKNFLRQGREAKALRWLGFIQGLLFLGGVFSIAELKGHNRGRI